MHHTMPDLLCLIWHKKIQRTFRHKIVWWVYDLIGGVRLGLNTKITWITVSWIVCVCICAPTHTPSSIQLCIFSFCTVYPAPSSIQAVQNWQCMFITTVCVFLCHQGLTSAAGFKQLWPNMNFLRAGNEDGLLMEQRGRMRALLDLILGWCLKTEKKQGSPKSNLIKVYWLNLHLLIIWVHVTESVQDFWFLVYFLKDLFRNQAIFKRGCYTLHGSGFRADVPWYQGSPGEASASWQDQLPS